MVNPGKKLWVYPVAAVILGVATALVTVHIPAQEVVAVSRPPDFASADRWAELWRAKVAAEAAAARWERVSRGILNGVTFDADCYYPPVDVYDLLGGEPNPPGTVILEVGPGRYQFVDEYAVLTPEERAHVLTRDEMIGAYLAWDAKWRRSQLEPPWRRRIKGGAPAPAPAQPAKGEDVPASPVERSPAKEVCIPEPAPAGTAEESDVEPGES